MRFDACPLKNLRVLCVKLERFVARGDAEFAEHFKTSRLRASASPRDKKHGARTFPKKTLSYKKPYTLISTHQYNHRSIL
jgi:hypothetical protein